MGRPLKWGESCRRVTVSLPERLYVDLCVDGRSVSGEVVRRLLFVSCGGRFSEVVRDADDG